LSGGEHEDGTVSYYGSGSFTQAFRVAIADVTGFSVVKGGKMFERTLNVMGSGSLLASVSVNHGTSEKIEEWFKSHTAFGTRTTHVSHAALAPAAPESSSVADEIRKLASLRDEGLLTEAEFAAQKAKLLQ
jgi:hypothetical protein